MNQKLTDFFFMLLHHHTILLEVILVYGYLGFWLAVGLLISSLLNHLK